MMPSVVMPTAARILRKLSETSTYPVLPFEAIQNTRETVDIEAIKRVNVHIHSERVGRHRDEPKSRAPSRAHRRTAEAIDGCVNERGA